MRVAASPSTHAKPAATLPRSPPSHPHPPPAAPASDPVGVPLVGTLLHPHGRRSLEKAGPRPASSARPAKAHHSVYDAPDPPAAPASAPVWVPLWAPSSVPSTARRWNRLSATLGHSDADLLIADTALQPGLTVVTRNTRHFHPTGAPLLNPFLPPEDQ